MSANRLDLSSRPVIVVVVVLLALVGFYNFHTFGRTGPGTARTTVRLQSAPPFPADLSDVVRSCGEPMVGAAMVRGKRPDLARDPFVGAASAPAPVTARRTRPARHATRKKLVCDAVFPGGYNPLALIKGKPYHLGDKVGRYTVRKIDALGVVLAAAGGKDLFLAVGARDESRGTSRVITSLPGADPDGRTRLVEYEHSERKLP